MSASPHDLLNGRLHMQATVFAFDGFVVCARGRIDRMEKSTLESMRRTPDD
ncbi:hypothetical protein COLSTE_01460 [Collinsella stercoris DSM 13279]|uniref:Uncharacterized protein n=1 Tax=Collinsella stercoris DSM 13279 TaxID=445975 RepID=B6GBK0_9ACTN|nr:hypothetical protein COLSTE_01460 [Collinsella stercoris DSM 13279]